MRSSDGPARILVDVDGTLAHQLPQTCRYLDEVYDVSVAPTAVDEWSFPIPELDRHIGEVIDEIFERRPSWYLRGMEPLAGAADALERLVETHEVAIATHRPASTHVHTRAWLDDHDIPYDEFVEQVPQNKADLRGDVLVDDYHGNVADALAAGMDGVLFSQPYSDHSACEGATVVESWAQALRGFDL